MMYPGPKTSRCSGECFSAHRRYADSAPQGAGFSDVPAGASYAQAVAWAVGKGVTNGTSPTTFSPGDTCTRGQIVTFLHRDLV